VRTKPKTRWAAPSLALLLTAACSEQGAANPSNGATGDVGPTLGGAAAGGTGTPPSGGDANGATGIGGDGTAGSPGAGGGTAAGGGPSSGGAQSGGASPGSGGTVTGSGAAGATSGAATGGSGDGGAPGGAGIGGAGDAPATAGTTHAAGSGGEATSGGSDGAGGAGGSGDAPSGGGGNVPGTGGSPVVVDGVSYLSDLCDQGSENGWGPVERDLSNGEQEARDGGPLIINGTAFGKGFGMHAPAQITFALGGRCSALLAEVGIDEEMKGSGSVVFQVWGDDQPLYESDAIGGWQGPVPIEVDVSGVQSLRLVVDDDGGSGSDHADWGDARVVCEQLDATTCAPPTAEIPVPSGWHLAWSDEFDVEGRPDPANWDYESGMVRNNEWQYYTDQNATVVGGFLIIQGRRESFQGADYTSSSLRTVRYSPWEAMHTFQYGRFELRGRIVAEPGMWPAFWTLGTGLGNWPFNGEIDIMEYYADSVHANVASSASTDQNAYSARWDSASRPISDFGIEDWDAKFHVWRMDWDSERIVLSIDDSVMNDVPIQSMLNADGSNPFAQPHYLLVNLAIGGNAGGDASGTHFPVHYVVDYVRVYQQE
jgi:beta-glucanase (GH16 family)